MAARSIHKPRILVTEDHPDTRDIIALALNREGYEVICTESPQDALNRAQTERFDLFIVDNWLPGMSGLQLTQKLREFNLTTPILFCTGCGFQKDKAEARDAGAQGYLVKPVDYDDLISEVVRLTSVAYLANTWNH